MSAVMSRPLADYTTAERTVDELDSAIRQLVWQMNAECYQMLVLVREFDDRFGWRKWSFKSCAEWLAWRSEIGLSAAREKVRIAHALRTLPAIAAAFAEGRLSYSKVRALTRVADRRQEDLLLAYALSTTAENVEERCRQIRNVAPDSVRHAQRAWMGRSLTMWRDDGRGLMRFTLEVPVEEGELICRALDCAVAAGEVTRDVDPTRFEPNEIDPADFWPVFHDGKEVGRVTDAVWSPRLERNIGYVWVPIELSEPGVRLDVESQHGHLVGTTAAIPFVDPRKQVPAASLR